MQPQEPTTPQVPNPTPVMPNPEPVAPDPAPMPSVPTPAPGTDLPQTPKKGMSKGIKILIIAIVSFFVIIPISVAILFGFINNSTKAMVSVSNKFFDSIQANDSGAAYATTSSGFKEATPEADFNELVTALSPALQGDEKITERKIVSQNGKTNGIVLYKLETSDGTVYVRAILEKSDEWKVHNFRSDKSPLEAILE